MTQLELDDAIVSSSPGASAVFDPTRTYRYQLWRHIGQSHRRVCWIMLNPSTADEAQDDPTIRRCIGFGRAWGFGSLVVVNLFALRSTDPRALRGHADPVGPDNDRAIVASARDASLVVAAWGVHGALGGRDAHVAELLASVRVDVHCLAMTKSGAPVHPLYQPGNALPKPWLRPRRST